MRTRTTSSVGSPTGSERRLPLRGTLRPRAALLAVLASFAACISVPGGTPAEKRAHVDAYAEESIALLLKQSPEVKAEFDAAKGYAVVHESGLKVPVFGGETGWGVVVDRESGKRTYVKQRGFEIGAGWGARVQRVISILHTTEQVQAARDGGFEFSAGAEAGAKVGDVGGGMQGAASSKSGASIYVLLETGAAATATAGVIRLSQYDALNTTDG